MRFRGGGVGHKSTRGATDFFKQDRDRLDTKTTTISSLYDDVANEILEQDNTDEPEDHHVLDEESVEDEEEDYGYVREALEVEAGVEVGQDDVSDHDLGPEDDAEAVDILDEFGYADL